MMNELLIRTAVYRTLHSMLLALSALYIGVRRNEEEDGDLAQYLEHLIHETMTIMALIDADGQADVLPGIYNDEAKPEA